MPILVLLPQNPQSLSLFTHICLTIVFISLFRQRIKDCYAQEWHDNIENSGKLQLYCNIKLCFESAKYLDVLREKKCISIMAKFRCSNHTLAIETGRHSIVSIPRDERICKYCKCVQNITVIENEFHFVMVCPAYNDMRQQILGDILKTRNIDHVNVFYNLLSTRDENGI